LSSKKLKTLYVKFVLQLIGGTLLIFFLLLGFVGMEAFSWAFHKYVMHGILWGIHKTHHLPHKGFLELNDIFSLCFGSFAIFCIVYGLEKHNMPLAGLGFGITIYGGVYFIVHDIAIHNRLRSVFLSRWAWVGRIRRAHKIHHKSLLRAPSKSFGLLFVHPSVFKKS